VERKKLAIYAGLLIITLAVLLPIAASFLIGELLPYIYAIGIIMTEPEEPRYGVTCDDFEGELSTGEKVRKGWLISDNITRYEDIPEDQKETLSNETIEVLKKLSFNATNYSRLSEEQKEVFREGINDTAQTDASNKTPPKYVLYKGNIYFCHGGRVWEE